MPFAVIIFPVLQSTEATGPFTHAYYIDGYWHQKQSQRWYLECRCGDNLPSTPQGDHCPYSCVTGGDEWCVPKHTNMMRVYQGNLGLYQLTFIAITIWNKSI